MNTKTTITNPAAVHHPAKVLPFLEKALSLGLTVAQDHNLRTDGVSSYTISSPTNPVDDWQLWIHHQSGPNGGRLTLTRYTPFPGGQRKSNTAKLTYQRAFYTITEMGDSLTRHHARTTAKTDQPRVIAEDDMRSVVRDIKADPAPAGRTIDQVDDMRDVVNGIQAQDVVVKLARNGRVALRLVRDNGPHRNHLSAATPSKIRHAFQRWGLINPDNSLTDLGRAARSLVLA